MTNKDFIYFLRLLHDVHKQFVIDADRFANRQVNTSIHKTAGEQVEVKARYEGQAEAFHHAATRLENLFRWFGMPYLKRETILSNIKQSAQGSKEETESKPPRSRNPVSGEWAD